MASHSNVRALKAFLDKQAIGPVADTVELKSFLADCWHQFEGCAETEMHAGKLDRIEDATWQPPYLELLIERHGAVVRGGSKYANLQRWRLDLEALTAEVNDAGRRLLVPKDKDLDTEPLAKSLADAILSGQPDERFKILPDGSVRLNIAVIIPATNAETTSKRRKRLHRDLSALLEPHGWRKTGPKVYSKEKPTP